MINLRIYYLQTTTNAGKKFLTEENGKAGICNEFDSRVRVFSTKREANAVCKQLNKQVRATFIVMG